jgi:dihydroorotase
MRLLIRQALIADPRSPHHGKHLDIITDKGKIVAIGNQLDATDAKQISVEGLVVSPGWIDLFANAGDPGMEQKESLETCAAAAAAGGYTQAILIPNTQPVIHAKSQVEYIVQKSKGLPVTMRPLGAISKNCEGKDLAEMYDMYASGAVAFSDGTHPLQNSQIMLKALQYVKSFDGVIVQVPDDENLTKLGLMHEGVTSTRMGLPGKPAIGEWLLLSRDIELLRYTGSKLHVTGISTAKSVELIRSAKAEGLNISCSVTPYHLSFCDEDLQQYDTNLKVNPALRSREDVEALKAAVLDGTVDCIASHHQPHEYDSKVCEFEYAKYGMEGMESAFAAVMTALPDLTKEQIANLFSLNTAKVFNIDVPVFEEGAEASLTLFAPNQEWTFTANDIRSLSKNNAFVGKTLVGKPIGILNGNNNIFTLNTI